MHTHAKNPIPDAEIIDRFKTAKAFAYFEGNWRTCPHCECKTRRTCTGGPRGTCRKTAGMPLCKMMATDRKAHRANG